MREQFDNSKSFNLVKECALFAVELERSIGQNVELGIQLFRTLNEFASGCPQNQLSLMESKIYVPINRIMQKFSESTDKQILKLIVRLLVKELTLVG